MKPVEALFYDFVPPMEAEMSFIDGLKSNLKPVKKNPVRHNLTTNLS